MKREEVYIRVRNDATKSKFTRVDLSFLLGWLGEYASKLASELEIFVRAKTSSTPIYSVRKVLEFWSVYSQSGSLPVFIELQPKQLEAQLSAMRYSFFRTETESGRSLLTTASRWNVFLAFICFLSERKIITPIRIESPALASPPASEMWLPRYEAVGILHSKGPRNLSYDNDSYNEDLFESLSISKCDESYVEEYTDRLEKTIKTIRDCAIQDLSELKNKRNQCTKILSSMSAEQLAKFKEPKNRKRFRDPETGVHMLQLPDDHPFLLSNLLHIAVNEMGGIPKQHFSYGANGKLSSVSLQPHWKSITLYGKNKLLPYLGLMSSFAMAPCLVILLLELPRINATSLMRAKISDENGRNILLSASGEGAGDEGLTITVDKPRARQEKSMRLSPLALDVMSFVLEWTLPIREEMIRRGQVEDAKWLWVGMNHINYKLINYSQKTAFNSLRLNEKHHSRGLIYNTSRSEAFVERHLCLKPWAEKITFKSLRLNAGVLEYLRSDGDLVTTARAFGHKNISTTIKNYIPRELRLAMYERQIRRHQNRLIISSLTSEDSMLQCSDFKTKEDLHIFLNTQPIIELSETITIIGDAAQINENIERKKVILYECSNTLAVAMLYRSHLQNAPMGYIDVPDRVTGIKPRFWIEFIDALMAPLPLAMENLCSLVAQATKKASLIKDQVKFPGFGL
ncbi:hypothetical protein YA0001_13670 [Pseudomonas viridiflava]|uniref:hypothetical protein n=1 Tax=Pseudomonas viridiflava TaxID=33069 RepID=UPI0018E622B7|nr:hypothetical protein [Pseudomonas viridiflava]MBI6578182.1 hypothetical protein [Pseudomonas viridiflava]MBI6610752.1 hypothetical protein [Pseudomonas viridiflava]MBI6637006.1 hypothetical protein [Pseudomonas viridiflava]MBI6868624.1 hypothetical protein [Pseudomonas viridiflava]